MWRHLFGFDDCPSSEFGKCSLLGAATTSRTWPLFWVKLRVKLQKVNCEKMGFLTHHDIQPQPGFHEDLSKHVQTSQTLTYCKLMTLWLQSYISWTFSHPVLNVEARYSKTVSMRNLISKFLWQWKIDRLQFYWHYMSGTAVQQASF